MPTMILRSERGSALLIAMMVMVILTLMGLSYLFMADTESLIAQNQRDSDQLLFVAEAGARMVKAWFDRPQFGSPSDPNTVLYKFLNNYDLRDSAEYDLTQRVFDHDDDPNTADVTADGSSGKPYHRQGMTVDPNVPAFMSFFDRPYRGSLEAAFMGTEAGPDLVIQSNSLDPNTTGTVDLLDEINALLFGDQQSTGRIQRIEVYGPPVIMLGTTPTRFGIATVKVTASKFRHMGESGSTPITIPESRRMAERVVKMVLNETPFPPPGGPLQSCTTIGTNGSFEVHWGATTAEADASYSTNTTQLQTRAHESIPWATQTSYISGSELTDYVTARAADPNASFIMDPWYRVLSGGTFDPPLDPNVAPGNQAQPYPYNSVTPLADDNSNIWQQSDVPCPEFNYELWKRIAQSGVGNTHYLVPVAPYTADQFQENGTGPIKTFAEWSSEDPSGGLFFFDTIDGLPPDPNGANLSPEIALSGTDNWAGAGFIYLNAVNLRHTGLAAAAINRAVIPPGEPYVDANGNRRFDTGEQYVNLQYMTTANNFFDPNDPTDFAVIDPTSTGQTSTVTTATGETFSYTTSTARDDQGPPILRPVNWYGVLYTSGTWEAQGNGIFFGSLVTKMGVVSTGGTANVFFDERIIKDQWPPPDMNLPRTMISLWETDL